MAEKVQEHDFIIVNYTGKLKDGLVFDTTEAKVAKEHNLFSEKVTYAPATICVGEKQLLPGLDKAFSGKEIGKTYTVTLQPEEAFGKRDVKNMKIMPMSAFKEHNMKPQPGLQINVDGQIGTISRVAGGRVIVNFNHPLAGQPITYEFTITEKVTDQKEQITTFITTTLRVPKEKIAVTIKENNATVELPVALPEPITKILEQKLVTVTKVKGVNFKQKTSS